MGMTFERAAKIDNIVKHHSAVVCQKFRCETRLDGKKASVPRPRWSEETLGTPFISNYRSAICFLNAPSLCTQSKIYFEVITNIFFGSKLNWHWESARLIDRRFSLYVVWLIKFFFFFFFCLLIHVLCLCFADSFFLFFFLAATRRKRIREYYYALAFQIFFCFRWLIRLKKFRRWRSTGFLIINTRECESSDQPTDWADRYFPMQWLTSTAAREDIKSKLKIIQRRTCVCALIWI